MTGIGLIATERQRQIESEHFDQSHDDKWIDGELATVGALYALPRWFRLIESATSSTIVSRLWPGSWGGGWWRPANSDGDQERIRELTKAGALIAAEIDRLQRKIARTSEKGD